jgi:phosphatidylglycerophosphate synthase
MIDHVLRRAKDALLTPIAESVGDKISPMKITLLASSVGALAAVAGWQGAYLLGLALWLINRFLDGMDGAVARICNRQTELGGYIDTLTDFAMYTIIPFGLVLHQPRLDLMMALAFLLGTFYINAAAFLYLAAILEQRNQGAKQRGELTTIVMPRGIIEGTEAIIFYSLFFLFPEHLLWLFLALGLLVIATTVQHIIWSVNHLH